MLRLVGEGGLKNLDISPGAGAVVIGRGDHTGIYAKFISRKHAEVVSDSEQMVLVAHKAAPPVIHNTQALKVDAKVKLVSGDIIQIEKYAYTVTAIVQEKEYKIRLEELYRKHYIDFKNRKET